MSIVSKHLNNQFVRVSSINQMNVNIRHQKKSHFTIHIKSVHKGVEYNGNVCDFKEI